MMNVIPVINCPDAACAKKKAGVLGTFLAPGSLVHVDITDGVFSAHPTWDDPAGWAALLAPYLIEVHLMVERPEEHADDWLSAGARRLVIHAETVTGTTLRHIFSIADASRAEIMLAAGPGPDIDTLMEPFLKRFGAERLSAFQVLAVPPGDAGQTFENEAAARIAFLRQSAPHATIEVDGGMNPETVRIVKAAGADTIVSSSYIFKSADPKKAYDELCNL